MSEGRVYFQPYVDELVSQRDDLERLARDLYDAMKVLFAEERPTAYHDCVDNGDAMCAWCYAEEEMNKAALIFDTDMPAPPQACT